MFLGIKIRKAVFNQREQNKSVLLRGPDSLSDPSARLAGLGPQGPRAAPAPGCEPHRDGPARRRGATAPVCSRPAQGRRTSLPGLASAGIAPPPSRVCLQHLQVALLRGHTVLPH